MTVTELLVAAPVMLIVLIGVFFLYNTGVHGQGRTDGRVRGLAQQQIGVERITRELRQATSMVPTSSQVVDVDTYVTPTAGGSPALRHVRYDCSAGLCRRYEGPAGGNTFTSGPVTVIAGLTNSNVFGMEPDYINPTYVSLNVTVAVTGQNSAIDLSGGVQLRNLARES